MKAETGTCSLSCRDSLRQLMRQAVLQINAIRQVTYLELITVKEVAQLKGCSEQYIRTTISKGKLQAYKSENPANKLKQYLIPLNTLDPMLQAKYYGKNKPKEKVLKLKKECKPLDCFSIDEREEIDFWIKAIKEWQEYRNNPMKISRLKIDFLFIFSMI